MPFAMLFEAIKSKIGPKDMKVVNVHYDLFRVCCTISYLFPSDFTLVFSYFLFLRTSICPFSPLVETIVRARKSVEMIL